MTTKAGNREATWTGERASEAIELAWNSYPVQRRKPLNRVVWRLWRTIPGMTIKRATRITWGAHTKGRAVAKSCHKELAELYEERLREKGLTGSIEHYR